MDILLRGYLVFRGCSWIYGWDLYRPLTSRKLRNAKLCGSLPFWGKLDELICWLYSKVGLLLCWLVALPILNRRGYVPETEPRLDAINT